MLLHPWYVVLCNLMFLCCSFYRNGYNFIFLTDHLMLWLYKICCYKTNLSLTNHSLVFSFLM